MTLPFSNTTLIPSMPPKHSPQHPFSSIPKGKCVIPKLLSPNRNRPKQQTTSRIRKIESNLHTAILPLSMADSTLRHRHRHITLPNPTFDFFSNPATLNSLALTTTNPSFSHNVRWFCSDYAERESYKVDDFPVWLTILVNRRNGVVFPLYLVEEKVSLDPDYFCLHCICAGWGNHYVSKRRYHVIVPVEGSWGKSLRDDAISEGQHLLHGMIHCNGFGHLLDMRGIDTSKAMLSREELMELFDVMCRLLKTRKVTVMDTLKKRQMELRLLHSITYGKPWYEEWGYKFCKGRFGVTEQVYSRSVELLTSLTISKVMRNFSGDEVLHKIIENYKDQCETQLTTISELLDFMLGFKSNGVHPLSKSELVTFTNPQVNMKKELNKVVVSSMKKSSISKCSKLSLWAERSDCRYPKRRLLSTAQTVVDILKGCQWNGNESAKMGRHELREILRQHVGDTGLIDFVLKSIDNVRVGDNIVRRICNAGTKKFEYSIEPFKGASTPTSVNDHKNKTELSQPVGPSPYSVLPNLVIMPKVDVLDDISYIYQSILKGYKHFDPVGLAANTIIDCKLFMKEWKLEEEVKDTMSTWVICRVLPSYDELTRFLTRPLPPAEIIEVSTDIGRDHMKMRLQCKLRDTYCIMDNFVVEEVTEYEEENGDQLCTHVWVKGSGLDAENVLRYEAGLYDDWKVNCHKHGAKEDDGEAMVHCVGCKVSMHDRCIGVGNLLENENHRCFMCRI